MATSTGFTTPVPSDDFALERMTWDERLALPCLALRFRSEAVFEGLRQARLTASIIAHAINDATEDVAKLPVIDIRTTHGDDKFTQGYAEAILRDFIKTQVNAQIVASLLKLATAIEARLGPVSNPDPAKILRDAAKQAEQAAQEREAALRQAKWDAGTAEIEKSNAEMQARLEKLKAMLPLPTKFDVTIT